MNIKMLTKTLAVSLIAAAALAGCSTTSGPAFNISEIQTSNGQKAFRAECYGLFTKGSACMAAAQKMCGTQNVNVLQYADGTKATNDPRDVIFNCAAPAQAPVQPAAEAQPVVVPAPVARKVSLDEKTNFAFDSATLTPKAREILGKLITDSNGAHYASATVEGFTDSTGPVAYNLNLSERRAQAVLDYLKGHGLQADTFSAKGFGKSRPVASNATSNGRAENRRVEVVLTP